MTAITTTDLDGGLAGSLPELPAGFRWQIDHKGNEYSVRLQKQVFQHESYGWFGRLKNPAGWTWTTVRKEEFYFFTSSGGVKHLKQRISQVADSLLVAYKNYCEVQNFNKEALGAYEPVSKV